MLQDYNQFLEKGEIIKTTFFKMVFIIHDALKEKIYQDLRDNAIKILESKLANFMSDFDKIEGSEFNNAKKLTPASLESYMDRMLEKAVILWKKQGANFHNFFWESTTFVELSKIFTLHTLSLAFKYIAEFKPSCSEDGIGGRLPKCVTYRPHTDLQSWSLSISNFIISVMYQEIGWDVKKYPTIASREKSYRNKDTHSEIKNLEKNDIVAALREEDKAYNFVHLETDRFRKYLNKMFVDYDFYQEKSKSESALRFKPQDDPARIAYLEKNKKEKLSSAQNARKEPRIIPYSEWYLYAVQYLDSSRKLADPTPLDSNDDNFNSHYIRARLRANRLYRMIKESDSNYTDSDIKRLMKELHARRYPRKADANKVINEEEIIDFNKKMKEAHCVYPGYGNYRFIDNAENRIPPKEHWRYPKKVIPITTKSDLDTIELFQRALVCWMTSEEPPEEARTQLVGWMAKILSSYGYEELFKRISNLPQPNMLLSYKIFAILLYIWAPLLANDHQENTINQTIKSQLEILNQYITEWCGRFFNVYAYCMVPRLIEADLSPELLDNTMTLVLDKLFAELKNFT